MLCYVRQSPNYRRNWDVMVGGIQCESSGFLGIILFVEHVVIPFPHPSATVEIYRYRRVNCLADQCHTFKIIGKPATSVTDSLLFLNLSND